METLGETVRDALQPVTFVLTDLDDTLTLDGRLPSASYAALERLQSAHKSVVVVTGRPAGWCDMIARFWPVTAVVGENGAFYFRYDHERRQMIRRFQRSDAQRAADQIKLKHIFSDIQKKYGDVRLSADQAFRISDYAIDFCEDVERLSPEIISDIVRIFEQEGATAKISSIHVNAWFGNFSKLEMSLLLLDEAFGLSREDVRARTVYVGDSPNDEPMFEFFELSVGVANLRPFAEQMKSLPRWITKRPGGLGFEDLASLMI